jgi:hypothetical protein
MFQDTKMKICFKCNKTKELTNFHKNSGMKDGRLNKCAVCVKNDVDKWRLKNPDCRKKEHAKVRKKKGFKTREEWIADKKKNAAGRKATQLKYFHTRRARTKIKDELTEFVVEEGSKLCQTRNKMTGIKWHIDHIIPINHRDACGLHFFTNLQVVPAEWNVKKKHLNMETYWAGY